MAQILMPQKQSSDLDPLTLIAKGLQIAQGVYGIKTDMARLDQLGQENQWKQQDRDQAQADRSRNQGFTDQDRAYAQTQQDYKTGEQDFALKERQNKENGVIDKYQQIQLAKDFTISPTPLQGAIEAKSEDGSPLYLRAIRAKDPNAQAPGAGLKEVATIDAQGNPVTMFVQPTAGLTLPKSTTDGKAPSKDQFDAALFGKRMQQSGAIMDDLAAGGYDRTTNGQGLQSLLPETAKGDDLKSQDQAERNFVNAVLRRESGAAISASEFDSASKQYFPRTGDTQDVLAQKQQNRQQAVAGFQAAAGNAWDKVPDIPLVKTKKATTEAPLISPEDAKAELKRRGLLKDDQ